jgi:D-alanine--poly(phosphoribitol) ligase subunit 1
MISEYQTNILTYLKDRLEEHPSSMAVIDPTTCKSFLELSQNSASIADWLLEHRAAVNGPILIMGHKGWQSIAAMLGTLLAGNFYCPLDANTPPERLKQIIDNLGPVAVIGDSVSLEKCQPFINNVPTLGFSEISKMRASECNRYFDYLESIHLDMNPAYIIYTSGTTGAPKGVVISHRSVIDYISWAHNEFSISESDSICSQAPFYFDNSILDIYLMLSTGAALHIIPDSYYVFPVQLIDYIEKNHISFIFWVPTILVSVANLNLLAGRSLNFLKNVLFAGEAMPAKQLRYWMHQLPAARFANLYGPTEITVDCTFAILTPLDIEGDIVPIGIPCRNTEILILSDENQLCAVGQRGELCVRGSSLALGYWRAVEKTNEVFIQNPLHNNYRDLIYRTGDVCEWRADGKILFHGRKDSQIKHLGYRIELAEIEVAASSHEAVKRCAVAYNYEASEIVLFVEQLFEPRKGDMLSHLRQRLPTYMLPRRIVVVDKMPLNTNGKINRKELTF